jgi:hypothetical protein
MDRTPGGPVGGGTRIDRWKIKWARGRAKRRKRNKPKEWKRRRMIDKRNQMRELERAQQSPYF